MFVCFLLLQAITALGNVPSVTVHSALMDVVSCSNYYYAVRVQAANVLAMVSILKVYCNVGTYTQFISCKHFITLIIWHTKVFSNSNLLSLYSFRH